MMNFAFLLNTLLHKRTSFRSSHKRCSVRKGVLRNFAKFTGKYLCQSLFFNQVSVLWSATSLKRDSGTGDFL